MHTAATWVGFRPMDDNQFLGRLRSRGWRRALAVGVWVSYALTVVLLADAVRNEVPYAWIIPAAASLGFATMVGLATRNVTFVLDAFADERDRALRDRSHRLAYMILGTLVMFVAGGIWGFAAGSADEGQPLVLTRATLSGFAVVVWGLALLWATLPSTVLAWTEPNPPPEENLS